MVAIVDYGLGNLGSIKNMLNKIGVDSEITSDPELIRSATKLILPGVGAFDRGMKNLEASGLIPVLEQKVLQEKIPVLGICLGMQLLTNKSAEGQLPGLGWVDAETLRFDAGGEAKKYPVPHMGWEYVSLKKSSALFQDMYEDPKFYFAHTYFVKCRQPDEVILTADYIGEFDAAFQKGNILGVQFHPEKSHKYGMKLLSNFITHF